MSKNFVTFVYYNCTEQIYKHFKQNKQTELKKVVFVVIYIRSKLFNSMSNRVGGYYRKNGTYVSPDGYGRKKGGRNNKDGFNGVILLILFFLFIIIVNKCSE